MWLAWLGDINFEDHLFQGLAQRIFNSLYCIHKNVTALSPLFLPGIINPYNNYIPKKKKIARLISGKSHSSAGDPITRRAQPSRGSCIIHPVGQVRSRRSMALRKRAPLSRALSPSRSRSWSGTRSGRCTGLRWNVSHVRAAIADRLEWRDVQLSTRDRRLFRIVACGG